MSSPTLAKASLYCLSTSIWCSVVFLALEEKGYGEDEIEFKEVNVNKGENFSPSYLRINPGATVPTLVVPKEQSLLADVENTYKAIRDTKSIVEFLDKSRTAISKTRTTSSAPAPALAPATVEDNDLSNIVIKLLHRPEVNLKLLLHSARTDAELEIKAKGPIGTSLIKRQEALEKYLSDLPIDLRSELSKPDLSERDKERIKLQYKRVEVILEDWKVKNGSRLAIYQPNCPRKDRDAFYTECRAMWEVELRKSLEGLEAAIKGPYTLGDQICLADIHLMGWLARIVKLAGGTRTKDGVLELEKWVGHRSEWTVGPKLKRFWEAAIQREAFLKVYKDGLH